ncbi:MAG TPA: NADH-ubiquinone oxidoreductase-F iron-sulfur binding region domain-containing protein [Verrucomicrobiae bacterium]|nr:NADH-ubiquinone oxidoreductase-F iron-sulfur binding region domain-containing protein [Verrucomicrobiae bacterium]
MTVACPPAAVARDRGRLLATERALAAAMRLPEHRRRHGGPPWHELPAAPAAGLIQLADAVDLRGRGGAGFPVARKLEAVTRSRATPMLLVNGVEGEPLSAKDRALLTAAPHLVLDGAMVLAVAIGAAAVVVATQARTLPGLERALAERGGQDPVPIRLAATPQAFVAGEETALVHWLMARDPRPTARPPRPFERGLDNRPTLVQNAETVAQVALLAAHGAAGYRSAGTPGEPGSTLVTLSGAVRWPGVYEIEVGSPVAQVLARAGGPTQPIRAVLAGGYFGAYLPAAALDRLLWSRAGLGQWGANSGAGVIHLLASSRCPARDAAHLATILARESAGQCGPCVHGLAAIAAGLRRLAAGPPGALDRELAQLHLWMDEVRGRGGCRFPDGSVATIASALRVFADDWEAHAVGGCVAGAGAAASLAGGGR